MRLWSFLVIPFLVTLTYGAPISDVEAPAAIPSESLVNAKEPEVAASAPVAVVQEKVDEVPVVPVADEQAAVPVESAPVPAVPEVESTTLPASAVPEEPVAETTVAPASEQDETNREGRQVDDDDEEEEADDDDDDDDDEDEEDEEEDEEDAARGENKPAAKLKSGNPSKKAALPGSGKPVPSLNEGGGEDDEAEDMGHFEGSGSPKSRENGSDEAESDENEEPNEEKEKANDEEEADEDDDEDSDEEEADEAAGNQGLVAESSSTEVQGAEPENEDAPPSPIIENEIEQQPLAVAVVQNEVSDVPVVPVIVSESPESPPPAIEQEEESGNKKSSNKKNKDDKEDDDDEEDDDDDDDEDEEEDDNAARAEKVSQARAAYDDARDADVLYYYPYPDPDHSQLGEF